MNASKLFRSAIGALTRPAQRRVVELLYPPGTQPDDFLLPTGEPALLAADSLSWRVFANPLAMFVGGVTAVLLELAEPCVRTGVWEHTTFRKQPMLRLQRTGYAAMMTVFGARSRTEAMITRINAGHARIVGRTPTGEAYAASDARLLTWVQATATFGFLRAYTTCVRPVDVSARDRFYSENQGAGRLYGVPSPPASEAELDALMQSMLPQLEPSPIVLEFLAIVHAIPLVPRPLRALQALLIRIAVQNLPVDVRHRLGLTDDRWRVSPWGWRIARMLGRAADHLTLPNLPAMLARQRLR
jgi:uncharacterized protein (DUF2236 family)